MVMDMLWPASVFLFALIPLLIVGYIWVLRRRRRFTVRYSSLSLVREAMPRYSRWRRHFPFVLFLTALASLILALTRPVNILAVPTNQTTIILAMDVSRSMCSTDIKPNRIEAAQAAALSFIQSQKVGTQIGVVAFSSFAELVQPPTSDKAVLEAAIESLLTGRGTAIGSGILRSIDAIAEIDPNVAPVYGREEPVPVPKGAYAPAIIVVLTDGVNINGILPEEAAQFAADRGIRVYTIGFGTASGGEMPRCSFRYWGNEQQFGGGGFGGGGGGFGGGGGGGRFRRGIDEDTLKLVSDMTGGKYYSAESTNELNDVFLNLPTNIIMKHEVMEVSVAFTAIGAMLAALAILLSMLWHPLP